jgi:hypothetical protein
VKILATGEWLSRERVIRVASLCAVASVLIIAVLFATSSGTLDLWGRPLGTDFSNVWAAGHMVLEGSAAKAWSWPDHFAVQQWMHHKADVDFFGWHYPPPFLLVAGLLALMPYVPALIVWQIATLAPLIWMMWRLVPRRETILLTLAAPVTLICLMSGHNGFLTALLLGGGLALMDRKPLVAGMLFGCLLYKPQFALIIPPLLLATRNWRAIVGAIASSGALIGLTLQLWGWPVWQAFIDSLPLTRAVVIEQGSTGFHKIMSPFAAIRMWGGPIPLAYAVQAAATVGCMAAVAWIGWFAKSANLRNALVCAAVLVSTPYVLDYDYVVLLPAIAFLWLDSEENGWLDWDKSLLAFAWIAPLAARQIAEFIYLPVGLATAAALFAIAFRRAVRCSERLGSAPAFA